MARGERNGTQEAQEAQEFFLYLVPLVLLVFRSFPGPSFAAQFFKQLHHEISQQQVLGFRDKLAVRAAAMIFDAVLAGFPG